jgi:hypothetical protein
MRFVLLVAFAAFASLGLLGCGPSLPPGFQVKGTVKYDGAAVPDGVINFDNTEKSKRGYSSLIKDGGYTLNMLAGKYTVRVEARKMAPYPAGTVGASGEKEGPLQYIPPKFNEQSTLTTDISGPNPNLNFDLTAK